jgi:CHAT domain-containing protein
VCPNGTPNLPFAERECASVAEHFSMHTSLKGNDARVAAVLAKLSQCPFVHFACHGVADWDDILSSSLVLADGRITVRDIQQHCELTHVRLVVLSACETGIVDFRQLPNANRGMNTALREAGAACVLSARWSVSDAASFLLMREFYAGLKRDAIGPSAALARAQHWLRNLTDDMARSELGFVPETVAGEKGKPFSNLYYWAAFGLTGL